MWLQVAVNRRPQPLLDAIQRSGAIGPHSLIIWNSPLEKENLREYRDLRALRKAGIAPSSLSTPLQRFWPARGPVWDAIGITSEGHPVFVEAKAHIAEAASPGTKASAKSKELIEKSLAAARRLYAPKATAVWSNVFYQYANRLAHHYFLTKLNGIHSSLVFLYFLNARDTSVPVCEEEWRGAIRLIHAALGLTSDLKQRRVFDAFLDVRLLENGIPSN